MTNQQQQCCILADVLCVTGKNRVYNISDIWFLFQVAYQEW